MPGTPIYHMTHIDNLPGIIANLGLLSDNAIQARGVSTVNIAHANIKQRRSRTSIIIGGLNRGSLAAFVPFYFCARSPMLYAIYSGMVKECKCNQSDIVYLVTTVEAITNNQ